MSTLLITIVAGVVLMGLAIAGLALGVMSGRPPIAGSCGGTAGGPCSACGRQGKCNNGASGSDRRSTRNNEARDGEATKC